MITEEEASRIQREYRDRRAKGIPDPVIVPKPLVPPVLVEEENKEPNVVPHFERKKCANCGVFGDVSKFVRAGKFCSHDCATRQANQLRMMANPNARSGASLMARRDSSDKRQSLLANNDIHTHEDSSNPRSSGSGQGKRRKTDTESLISNENIQERRKSTEKNTKNLVNGKKGNVFHRVRNEGLDFDINGTNNGHSLPSSPSSSSLLVTITPQSALHQSIFSLRVNQHQQPPPTAWDKHSLNLKPHLKDIQPLEVLKWQPDQVASFVNTIPGCQEVGQTFSDEVSFKDVLQICTNLFDIVTIQLIDGEAFLLLNQQDLVKILNIKLGPAVKIYNSIILIRDSLEASHTQ
jgi:hypothetical protein